MTDTERITLLEAQSMALLYVLRGIIPVIPIQPGDRLTLHTAALDAMNAHMEQDNADTAFQQQARQLHEALWDMLVS